MFELDIPSISAIVAAASVLVGVVLTVLELRHLVKQRKTELVTRLSSEFSTSRQFLEAFVDTLEVEFKDYDDFVKRYGKPISKKEVPMSFMTMGNFFEEIGTLYRNKLIDASLINQIFPISEVWEKMKPLVEGMRKEYHFPTLFDQFEYLYYEMKKREQKLERRGVNSG